MSSIAREKYVRLTTFTKDGRRKHTPVWIAELEDGTVGFTTGASSWKVKRIRNTPEVELTPSDARGRVQESAQTVTGTARVVTDADFAPVMAAIQKKYGFQATLVKLAGKVRSLFGKGGASSCGIIISLN